VLSFNILVFSHSTISARAACCTVLVSLCGLGACSTYGADLLVSDALAGGGSAGLGGAAAAQGGELEHGDAGEAGNGPVASGGGAELGGATGNPGAGAGQGGTSGGAHAGAAGFSNGGTATVVNPDLIDDLEDNDKSINFINSPRRDGIWDTGNDATAGGVQTPVPYMFLPTKLSAADAPYAGDQYAAYTKGSGFSMYGAYMNVSMRSYADYANTPQYDASKYKGISFLAKVGSTSTKSMRVRFISGDTDPRGKKCKLTGMHAELCYNHYFSVVTLSNTWQIYQLDFEQEFAQGGDGMTNDAIDLAGMYGLEFQFAPSNDFELWIDDLTFTK
jgi:hypothetical protein